MTDNRTIGDVCASIESVDGVSLRPWHVDDADVLVAAWNDAEIARWNPVPAEPTHALATSWIQGTASQRSNSSGVDVVMVRDGEVIGEIGLQIDRQQQVGELGFWIAASKRGEGLGSTMLDLACGLGGAVALRGLVAMVGPGNPAALSLLRGAGWNELPTQSSRKAFARRLVSPTPS